MNEKDKMLTIELPLTEESRDALMKAAAMQAQGNVVKSHKEVIGGKEITVIESFELTGFNLVPRDRG